MSYEKQDETRASHNETSYIFDKNATLDACASLKHGPSLARTQTGATLITCQILTTKKQKNLAEEKETQI